MSERIKYTNEPLGSLKIVRDFLPSPEDLVFRDEGVKVTLALSKRSGEFFKDEARKHRTQYQRMIRRLLDALRGTPFASTGHSLKKSARQDRSRRLTGISGEDSRKGRDRAA